MAIQLHRPSHHPGAKIEYLKPGDLPTVGMNPSAATDHVKTVYILREKVVEHHHTGWGFSAFNEFMNKALAIFAFLCIAGVGLAMLILALAVVSRF